MYFDGKNDPDDATMKREVGGDARPTCRASGTPATSRRCSATRTWTRTACRTTIGHQEGGGEHQGACWRVRRRRQPTMTPWTDDNTADNVGAAGNVATDTKADGSRRNADLHPGRGRRGHVPGAGRRPDRGWPPARMLDYETKNTYMVTVMARGPPRRIRLHPRDHYGHRRG